jgi:LL-H family phage holin
MTVLENTSLIELVVSTFVAIVAYVVLPVLRELIASKAGASKADLLIRLADDAVRTVAQEAGSADNNIKKAMAIAVLKGYLERDRVTLNDESVSSAIEAAVHRLKRIDGVELSRVTNFEPLRLADEDFTPFNPYKLDRE